MPPRYDGAADPAAFLQVYEEASRVAGGDNKVIANWFPMALAGVSRAWLLNLPGSSVTSWEEQHGLFVVCFVAPAPLTVATLLGGSLAPPSDCHVKQFFRQWGAGHGGGSKQGGAASAGGGGAAGPVWGRTAMRRVERRGCAASGACSGAAARLHGGAGRLRGEAAAEGRRAWQPQAEGRRGACNASGYRLGERAAGGGRARGAEDGDDQERGGWRPGLTCDAGNGSGLEVEDGDNGEVEAVVQLRGGVDRRRVKAAAFGGLVTKLRGVGGIRAEAGGRPGEGIDGGVGPMGSGWGASHGGGSEQGGAASAGGGGATGQVWGRTAMRRAEQRGCAASGSCSGAAARLHGGAGRLRGEAAAEGRRTWQLQAEGWRGACNASGYRLGERAAGGGRARGAEDGDEQERGGWRPGLTCGSGNGSGLEVEDGDDGEVEAVVQLRGGVDRRRVEAAASGGLVTKLRGVGGIRAEAGGRPGEGGPA
nr:glycine-rich cell wall structural protein-like [Aegilops tauschii subsp. strangulata]